MPEVELDLVAKRPNGTRTDVALMAMLKALHEQNEALKRIGNETNTLLVQISEHTRPAPSGE